MNRNNWQVDNFGIKRCVPMAAIHKDNELLENITGEGIILKIQYQKDNW